jgi:hypothetical protein
MSGPIIKSLGVNQHASLQNTFRATVTVDTPTPASGSLTVTWNNAHLVFRDAEPNPFTQSGGLVRWDNPPTGSYWVDLDCQHTAKLQATQVVAQGTDRGVPTSNASIDVQCPH